MDQDKKRTNNKLIAQVLNCMKILEFDDLEKIPMMKEVRKKFIRLVKAKHPDGGNGTEEDFIELFDAKEFLMNYIKVNFPVQVDIDEEETLARKEFDSANIENINEDSVTVFIPSYHVSTWRKCLSERYGDPRTLPTKHGVKPIQFKTDDKVSK